MSTCPITISETEVLVLKAHHGDAIIIKTFNASGIPFNIVVDGGTAKTYDEVLKKELASLTTIDVLVLTHIDSDHIAGLIKFLKNPFFKPEKIKQYWINSSNIKFLVSGNSISYNQAKTFEEFLITKGKLKDKWSEDIYLGKCPALPLGISVEILSPTADVLYELYEKWPDLSEEYTKKLKDVFISTVAVSQIAKGTLEDLASADFSPEKTIMGDLLNSSSIAFVLKVPDLAILLLGDSHPELIRNSKVFNGYSTDNKLKVDFVKVSHHGSLNNTLNDVLDMIDCDKFIISTNGGSSDNKHPDRETIARIVHHPERKKSGYTSLRRIYLNYSLKQIESKAGTLVDKDDFLNGNWRLIENVNIFKL